MQIKLPLFTDLSDIEIDFPSALYYHAREQSADSDYYNIPSQQRVFDFDLFLDRLRRENIEFELLPDNQ